VPEWSAEVTVDAELVRRIISEQFPELPVGSLRLLGEGWDTTVWLVDDEWAFRFPRREYVITGIENEMALLPRLAPLLPLPIPNPAFLGQPSDAYRWPFYGARFLPGRELAEAVLDEEERARLAEPLADFLRTLHSLELHDELPVDPVRRADMARRVPRTRERLGEVKALQIWSPPGLVDELLEAAEGLAPPTPTAVAHGDLHIRHLLVGERGDPTAVIDWIDLSRSDPCVDLVLYWCLLPPAGRTKFLRVYGAVSDEQQLRARVLSLFLCGTLAVYAEHEGKPRLKSAAIAGLEQTVS
jgi:aminoglycoside phosphotransferase (APT) family kinase protein